MKIVTASNGKQTVKMSKADWQSIGKKAGWLKLANDIHDIESVDGEDEYKINKGIFGDDISEINYWYVICFPKMYNSENRWCGFLANMDDMEYDLYDFSTLCGNTTGLYKDKQEAIKIAKEESIKHPEWGSYRIDYKSEL